jgi:molybdopterin-binding protein
VAHFLGVNAFKGTAVKASSGVLEVEVYGVPLRSCSTLNLVGKAVTVTVKPEDILLSKSPHLDFNPGLGNHLEGIITEMVQMRSTAQVTVDVGFLLKSRLPLSSIRESGINIGDKVYACFNTGALNVFEENSSE